MYTQIDALNDRIKECKMKITLARTSFSLWKQAHSDYVWWYEQAIESCERRKLELM